MHIIENHNNIEELRKSDNKAFARLKQYLIIGIRKTHKFVPNKKISDYLVPYTYSGCVAMCLYCYLVCNFNKCSYFGILIAPIILTENWKNKYLELIKYLDEKLSINARKKIFFEVIFMTYSYIHRMINGDVFPKVAEEIYKAEMMKGRGNGKYVYKTYLREEGENFINEILKKYFPNNEIKYIS